MTKLLEHAFQEASNLPVIQQNMIARWLLEELATERKWDSLFAKSEDFLAGLADEALKEHRAGRTKPLDLDSLLFHIRQKNSGNYIPSCRQIYENKKKLRILNSKTIHIIQVYNSSGFIPASQFIRYGQTLTIERWALLMKLQLFGSGLVSIENMKKYCKSYSLIFCSRYCAAAQQ